MRLDLPRVILVLCIALIVAGIALHGIGFAQFQRIWEHEMARPGGSLAMRFFLQPAMSVFFAARDGIKDARTGRSPYFWTVVSDSGERRAHLREGLSSTGKIILIALLLDGIYQVIEFGTVYPVEALIAAVLLAFVPYLLLRGPIARAARWWMARKSNGSVS